MKGSQEKGHMNKENLRSAEKQGEKFDHALGEITEKMLKQGMTPKDAIGFYEK